MKVCSKCGVPKELSDFNKDRATKDGHLGRCKLCEKKRRESNKDCIAEQYKKWYEANKEMVAGQKKKYEEDNKESLKRYRADNKEKRNEQSRKWYEDNKERAAERAKEWRGDNKKSIEKYREANKERDAEKSKKWREGNKERHAILTKKWQKANSDKVRSKSAKRRSAKLNAFPPWIAAAERLQIEEFYTLAIMQSGSTGKDHHVDHIHPLIHPLICGLHVPSNLQILEASINLSKNNRFEPYIESECDFTELWQVRSDDRTLIPTPIDRIPRRNPSGLIKPKKPKAVAKGQLALF